MSAKRNVLVTKIDTSSSLWLVLIDYIAEAASSAASNFNQVFALERLHSANDAQSVVVQLVRIDLEVVLVLFKKDSIVAE